MRDLLLSDATQQPELRGAKPIASKSVHTGPMRSKPKRSRPIRGKRPRYIDGRLTPRPRPQASKLSLRQAPARAARTPETFPGCPCRRHRHSPDSHRAHGAWCAGASIDNDPSTRGRLGRAARRVGERPRESVQDAVKRLVAGRPRPPLHDDQDRPRIAYRCLTVCSNGTTESTGVIFTWLTSLPVSSPRLCHRDGKGEGRNIPTAWDLVSRAPAAATVLATLMLGRY